jgi:hypothetical protein
MREAIASYRKTTVASFLAGLAVISAAYAGQRFAPAVVPAPLIFLLALLGWAGGLALLLVAAGGVLASFRHSSRERGEPDLFITLNAPRSESALLGQDGHGRSNGFSWLRRLLGAPAPQVGDLVRIRSLEEISATLDANGCLDGLPFMPEMAKFCGSTGTVYRQVDKVYDYGGRKDLRRMKDAVLITGLRCDGAAHDGCQARCYLLWKSAWITPVGVSARPAQVGNSAIRLAPAVVNGGGGTDKRYLCQYTELARASTKMSPRDLRQALRPLVAGNITFGAFAVAVLTRLFNLVQAWRGGIAFPPCEPTSTAASLRVDLNLQPGEPVRVREPERILETLDRIGKNRGLWFDRDMLKHTKQQRTVLARVDRIIDDATGQMREMKTPCVILDGVDATGELLGFCPQHDFTFWREAWLERTQPAKEPA